LDLAIADFTKTIELNPKYAPAYADRGSIYSSRTQWDMAIADFSKAIELDPVYAYAYNYRGFAYSQKGQKELAVADLKMCISLSKDPALTQIAQRNLDSIQ